MGVCARNGVTGNPLSFWVIVMKVDEIWSRLKAIRSLAEEVNAAENILYGVEEEIEKAKERLMRIAVSRVLDQYGIRNLEVPKEIYDEIRKGEIRMARVEEILKPLIEAADDAALEQMLQGASRLVPYVWEEDGARPPRVDEIVKGRRLHLRVYWSYGNISFSSMEYILALDKVIPALIGREPASRVKPMGIYSLIHDAWSFGDYSQARQYVLDNQYIDGFRIYKNGKFVIVFKKEDDARMVAKALIDASK